MHIPHGEPVSFNLDSKSVPATLQQLSLTGGVVESSYNISNHIFAEIRLETASGPVSGLVEFFKAQSNGSAYVQPFRFVAMEDEDHARLSRTLKLMQRKESA